MNNKINLSQLVELFAQASGMSRVASEQFVKSFFDMISQNVISDELVKVKGLGTFKLLRMEDRESVNVNTGERFIIEGHQKISFTPDAELKELINKPFSAFGTVIITDEQAQVLEEMNTPEQTADTDDEPADETVQEPVQEPVEETVQVPVEEPAQESAEETVEEHVEETVPDSREETPIIVKIDNQEQNENKAPEIKEITQKRSTRFLLKGTVAILSVVLLAGVGLFLFWPLIGVEILDHFDKANTELVAKETPGKAAVKPEPVKEVKAEPKQEAKAEPKQEAKAEPKQEAKVEPKQEVKVEPKQEAKVEPKQEVKVEPKQEAKVEPKQEVKAEPKAATVLFELNAADAAKDLADFSVADTVNYSMTGVLAEHVMKNGETLTGIALKYYGTKKLWPYIAKYNKLVNFNRMKPGDKIIVPRLSRK